MTLGDYTNFKEREKKGKGINSELSFLKKQIKIEKEALANLQKEKSRDQEETEFRTTKVDDSKQLEALRTNLELYYDLGSNEEKYYRYYQQGKLDKKLQKYYGETDVELAKKYLEEKGPVFIKRRNNSK
jgi:thiamine pyrophosphokinase